MKMFAPLFIASLLFSNSGYAQDFLYEHAEKERTRINKMSEIAQQGNSATENLTVRELIDLKCNISQNGAWIQCDWPYTSAECTRIGWKMHPDGSCCHRVNYKGPFSFNSK